MLTRPLVCRIRSNLLLLVAITTISLSCSHFFAIRSVEGVRVSSPFLNTYGIDVLSLNYSHVTTDPDILPFLLQRTIIRQFDSILADYTPLQRVTVGNMVIMDPGIYAGLTNEYLCEMPPSELNLNPALLRDSGVSSRGIYRKRELKPSDPRWPDFNGTISLEGAVLVVARGNCSFQAKSYYAQRVGAAGLIVTNPFPPQMTPASLDYLVTMHRDPAFTEQLREEGVIRENEEFQFTTPSIFMTAASVAQIYYSFLTNLFNQAEMYQTLQLFLWNEAHPEAAAASSSTGASGPGSSNTTSPSTSEFIEGTGLTGIGGVGGAQSTDVNTNGNVVLRRLLHVRQALEAQRRHLLQSQPPPTDLWPPPYVPEFEYTPPLVAIDVDSVFPGSKSSDSPSYDSFRVAAYFLLILPSLWFCVAVMYVGRKCSMRLRERRRREARNKLIQSVKYHVPTSNEMKETKFIAALAPTPCVHTSPPAPSKSSPRHTAVMATNPTSSNRLDASLLAHEEKEDAEANVEMQPVQPRPSHTGALTDVALHPSSSMSFRDTFHHETATAGMSAAAARVFDEDDDDEDGASDPTDASIHLTSQPSPSANATPSQGCGMLGKNPVKIVGVACAICLSDFEEGETLSLLPCHHAFHPQCITPWLEKSDECALCRNSVSSHLLDDDTSSCCPSFCCPVSDSGLDRRMRQLEAERRAGNVEARAELIRERAIRAAAHASAPAVAEQSQQHQNENGQSVMVTPVSPNTASQHSIDGSIELFPTIQPPTITSSPTPVLPSSSSSSASPFGPFTDDRYHTARVRDASESFVRLVRRSGLMDESTPVEAAVLEIELASKEYALTYAPSAQPMALSDADALVLLTQLQSECNLITRHCIDSHPDLLEAALVYESTLQYVHEAIARRIKVNEPAMNN